MHKFELQAVVWKEDRRFISQCLNVDIASFGTTKKAALKNLSEALELYFEDHKTHRPGKVKSPNIVSMKLQYA